MACRATVSLLFLIDSSAIRFTQQRGEGLLADAHAWSSATNRVNVANASLAKAEQYVWNTCVPGNARLYLTDYSLDPRRCIPRLPMEMLVLRRRNSPENSGLPVGAVTQTVAIAEDLPPSEIRGLPRDENVAAAAPPMPLRLIAPDRSSDSQSPISSSSDWGLSAVGALKSPFDGTPATVAVLDTGIDVTHPAFNGLDVTGRNFANGGANDFRDFDGHGTHCAGTIFGRDVSGQRIGIARNLNKALIGRVLGPDGGSTTGLLRAINWSVEHEAQIISMSLGIDMVEYRDQLEGAGRHPREATSMALTAMIDNVRFFDTFARLLRTGEAFWGTALIVAACGNGSGRVNRPPFVLGAEYPSAAPDFLAVSAMELTNDHSRPYRVASFSNSGGDYMAPGVGIRSAALGGGLTYMSGTSMAAPHVAGVAALWAHKLIANGRCSAQRILDSLKSSARLPDGIDEVDAGYGIPQAPQA